MPARLFLATAIALAAWSTAVAARDLTVVARGEAMQAGITDAYAHPFTSATSIAVEMGTWDGGMDALRDHLKAQDNAWDLIVLDADEVATACGEALVEKLDWSAVGGKDHYQGQAVTDCGLGAVMSSVVLAWDKDKFPVTPTWADFWDVAKYPGKRGLAKSPRGALEIALMADGVAPGDVYKALASGDGVDRAFRKLDQLKPYIVWWQTEIEAARILRSGDVLMTSAPSGVIATAARTENRNFGLQWNGSLYSILSWAIVKGSPNLKQAQQFLYFVGIPAVEARLMRAAGAIGFAKGANDGLPPDLSVNSPTSQANLAGALHEDTGFWHDNQAKLRARFDTWLQK